MKNKSNIYDIDGELLRHIDDTSELSVEEAKKRIEKYKNKLEELEKTPENKKKIDAYSTYIRNLSSYIFNKQLKDIQLGKIQQNIQDEVTEALKDTEKTVDNMDEYTDFEEIPQ